MKDSERPPKSGRLFDLPLEEPEPRQERTGFRPTDPSPLPLFPEEEDPPARKPAAKTPAQTPSEPPVRATGPPTGGPREKIYVSPVKEMEESKTPMAPVSALRPADLKGRWLAGGVDALLHVLLLAILIAGGRWLGVEIGLGGLPALLLFLAAFSFLYSVIPLAFWGQTPGMIHAELVARSGREDPLTFGQCALRWIGMILTLAGLGLPSALALWGGGSLTDRLSSSKTWIRAR